MYFIVHAAFVRIKLMMMMMMMMMMMIEYSFGAERWQTKEVIKNVTNWCRALY